MLLGIAAFVGQIPTFIISPFAGVIIDRYNKFKILMWVHIISMIQASLLAFLVITNYAQIWHILVLSAILGIVTSFEMPIRQSFMIYLIENKDDLFNAISLHASLVNIARFVGPALAGVIIGFKGEGICFLINAVSCIFVIIFILMMKLEYKYEKSLQKINIAKELKEGFKYTFGFLPIRNVIIILAIISLMSMPHTILMPAFVKNDLGGESQTFGFLMGINGLGAVFGAIYLASRNTAKGIIKFIPIAAIVVGLSMITFSIFAKYLQSPAIAAPIMAISGMSVLFVLTCSNTFLQTTSAEDKRGRVMSFYTMAFMGTAPFGSLLAGFLGDTLGPVITIIICGTACLLTAIWFLYNLKSMSDFV
jgi:MFS family permease